MAISNLSKNKGTFRTVRVKQREATGAAGHPADSVRAVGFLRGAPMPALVIVLWGLVLFLTSFLGVLVGPLVGEITPIKKQRSIERSYGF